MYYLGTDLASSTIATSDKTLIIAEKPSVAADIARALGGFTRTGDFFESDDFVLSSAVGHLVEIAAPEKYEVKRGKWSFAHLPVIPPHFDLSPIAKSEDRLRLLTRLIKRKDVTALINACDAGREGELIFRLIAQHSKAKQPVKRLWLQSMTPAAIREAFAQLRSDKQMMPLADAARCRSESDWLVGINGTRAMTAFNSQDGGFYLTTVGRVQTPTLTIVVEREEKIKRFISRGYFEVKANFAVSAGQYIGKYFDPKFKKNEDDPEQRADRLWDLAKAQAIVDACQGQPGKVTEETKPSSQMSPALFDLTSLQREANGRFGFSAKTTLSLAQSLYERHKALTYPRTDSRFLPEDYLATVQKTMAEMESIPGIGVFAKQALAKGYVKANKKIFDNAKVSDHFAIIPTMQAPKNLSEAEQKIYDLVAKRFLSVFYPPAEYLVSTRITEVRSHSFKTEGRVLVNPGWLAIYGREQQTDDDQIVPVKSGEQALTKEIELLKLVTKPPARYSEATLLSAMEGAGKLMEEDELREAMVGKGLGTPATRSTIIEGLINENYMIRDGRELIPTAKAFQLLTLLRGLGVQELTKPELTGEWEYKLSLIEQGKLERDTFMNEIAEMTRQIVERAKNYGSTTVPGDYATLTAPCPKCGKVVKENYKRFACTECDFSISKTPGSRQFEVPEVEQLLREKTLGPLQGFRSKMGRPFAAILKITAEHKLEFDFGQGQVGEDGEQEAVDFTGKTAIGPCPKCGNQVFEHGLSYVCEESVANPKTCDFRSGKIILQQEIENAQMQKLLVEGRTDLLQNFISSRTRRKFKAFLVKGAEGKIGFEFQARPVKPGDEGKPVKAYVAKPSASKAAPGKAGKAAKAKAGLKSSLNAVAKDDEGADVVLSPVKKAATKKAAPKKVAVKKPSAKKVATKATPAKKPAAKKPAAKKVGPKK